jgi:membrane fusion protein (multidrug efflux system)
MIRKNRSQSNGAGTLLVESGRVEPMAPLDSPPTLAPGALAEGGDGRPLVPSVASPPVAAPDPSTHARRVKRPLVLALAALAAVVLVGVGWWYYEVAAPYETTDDAFIEGHVISISPKVAGHVLRLHVTDNQEVQAGDLLVEIDPRDFEARLAQARAALAAATAKHRAAQISVGATRLTTGGGLQQASSGVEAARAQVEAARRRLEAVRAEVRAAEAENVRNQTDVQRYERLYAENGIARQQVDYAIAAAKTSEAALTAARANERAAAETLRQAEAQVGQATGQLVAARAAPDQVAMSQAQVDSSTADIEQLRAAVRLAELELSYTKITAPETGRVTRKTVEAGNYVSVGQGLFMLVPRDVWVIANFKETQLTHMRPGQPVKIRVDAYPGVPFSGHLDSIQAGTGARFSLLPPENATGNYVKVVQRVPVKVLFDAVPDGTHPVGPGMSVTTSTRVR